MGEEMVTTAVDDLLEYLRGKDKVAMQDVASVLNVPLETLQSWVDFLVEEKLLGIEYKFTKPYIYINQAEKPAVPRAAITIEEIRAAFMDRARAKQLPEQKLSTLWRDHVADALARKRTYFMEQAGQRRLANPEQLWARYERTVLEASSRGT